MSDADPRSESRIAAAEKEIEKLGSRIRELKSEIEQLRSILQTERTHVSRIISRLLVPRIS